MANRPIDWLRKKREIGSSEIKQVIVMRTDLDMGKGKLATQAGHAAVSGFIKVNGAYKAVADRWGREGQKKVVLKVIGEGELIKLSEAAEREGVPYVIIHDAGLTQIEPGTMTCISLGPWPAEELDKITGKLKLL